MWFDWYSLLCARTKLDPDDDDGIDVDTMDDSLLYDDMEIFFFFFDESMHAD